MTRAQHRRRCIWIGSALGGLIWLAALIVPAAIAGHITAEQPAITIDR
jgi:hypothetical protein